MFGTFRRQWHDLTKAKPGSRFQNRYHGCKGRRENPALKVCYIALGTLILVVGLVLLPAPGPGALVMFLGAAMLAEELLWVARACDAAEVKIRALLRRATGPLRRRSNRGG